MLCMLTTSVKLTVGPGTQPVACVLDTIKVTPTKCTPCTTKNHRGKYALAHITQELLHTERTPCPTPDCSVLPVIHSPARGLA